MQLLRQTPLACRLFCLNLPKLTCASHRIRLTPFDSLIVHVQLRVFLARAYCLDHFRESLSSHHPRFDARRASPRFLANGSVLVSRRRSDPGVQL